MEEKITRRDILAKAAVLGVGIAVGSAGTRVASADTAEHGSTEPESKKDEPQSGEEPIMRQWPWPYVKLDPVETAELAYNGWYELGCGGTVVMSIFSQLAKKVGDPYKSFPDESFVIFEGGLGGWGTLCGSLNGAAMVCSLIIGPPTKDETSVLMAINTMDWYSHAIMPIYVPKEPRANVDGIVHTVSDSPLCHVSVGKWEKKSKFATSSPERKDRCARVSASVAYKLVMTLNEWVDGNYHEEVTWFGPQKALMPAQYNCADCHGKNVPKAPQPEKK